MPKIIHYRDKCIGCGVCQQRQPEYWRMSKKDGKATLVNAVHKKDMYVLAIHQQLVQVSQELAAECPVRVIKITV